MSCYFLLERVLIKVVFYVGVFVLSIQMRVINIQIKKWVH